MSICVKVLFSILIFNTRGNKSIVDEVTTLRRHLEACHAVRDIYILVFNF